MKRSLINNQVKGADIIIIMDAIVVFVCVITVF